MTHKTTAGEQAFLCFSQCVSTSAVPLMTGGVTGAGAMAALVVFHIIELSAELFSISVVTSFRVYTAVGDIRC